MQKQLRAGNWQKLMALETKYVELSKQLQQEADIGHLDETAIAVMVRLDQQQRRLQRHLTAGLRETQEKIAVIDDARTRLQNSQRIAAAL